MEKRSTLSPNYWEERKQNGLAALGRPKSLESPAQLWALACEYFEQTDATPWERTDFKGKENERVSIPTDAPYLWSGFDDFLFSKGITKSLKDYRTASRNPDYREGAYKDFSEVVTRIDNVMTTQKVSGALVGAYNANLTARLEGLADKTETDVKIVDETKIGFE
jgi:hypothetical protein